MLDMHMEELKINGFSYIGEILNSNEVGWFYNHITSEKKKEIDEFGVDYLKKCYALEVLPDLARFGEKYHNIILNEKINSIVDTALNNKAVIHSYNSIILDNNEKSDIQGYKFHRDMPWFPDCRTSIIIMIPLIDFSSQNGSTQFVPGTHMFRNMPSEEYLEKHVISVQGKAGEAYVVDSTLWHRSGKNNSELPRPMIVLRYSLAPFKQQIDFCLSNTNLEHAHPLVKQRLGWDVRVPSNYLDGRDWNQSTRKFKSGQYDMTNTYLYE